MNRGKRLCLRCALPVRFELALFGNGTELDAARWPAVASALMPSLEAPIAG